MRERIENYIKFLSEIELLKSVTRHSWMSSGRQESVAEHSWRLAMMALVLEDEFDVDMKKVIQMVLVHDLGEAYEGDFPAIKEQPKNKIEIEEKCVNGITSHLPEKMREKIKGLIDEYNEAKTPEAKVAKVFDKLEVLIQHNEGDISKWDGKEYEFNFTYGKEFTDLNEFTKEFRKIVDEHTRKKIENESIDNIRKSKKGQ